MRGVPVTRPLPKQGRRKLGEDGRLTVVTNGVPRETLTWDDLSAKERAWHDWDGAEDHTFIRYRGHAEPLESYRVLRGGPLTSDGWDGGAADSFFSGTLVRFVDDGRVIVGRYCE